MEAAQPLKLWLALGILIVIGAVLFPFFSVTTNCGGNSAALAAVSAYASAAQYEASDSPDHVFHVTDDTPLHREVFTRLPGTSMLPRGRFMVSTEALSAKSSARRVIIACDTPFSNVPERWLGSAPPSHAVGFSDGSTALISPAEFAALDRSSFVALDELYPAPPRPAP